VTTPTLQTERLLLVPLSDQHLELEVELDSDPEVMRYLGGRARTREEVVEAHERRVGLADHVPGLGFWAAFDGDEFVGLVWAPPAHGPDQPDDPTVWDQGYRLLRRCWRRRYETEASRELLRHAFETVGQSRVIAQTQEGNEGSRAVMERLGMRFVRTYHSLDYPEQGPEVQEVEYELTRETWRDSQGAPTSSD